MDIKCKTLEEMHRKIKEIVMDLFDDDIIDKYAVTDWLFGLDEDTSKTFFLNEHIGYHFSCE